MCGITGIVYSPGQAVDRAEIESMTQSLRHRGPDAQGVYLAGNVALGHRRLSIIDTRAEANQPLFNEDGSVCVVFNGEIYNYQTLASELKSLGHRFRTQSDTEVLVHAWEQWGAACVERLRGMFAFAVYDANRGRLFLARDRLGKKPLYYAHRSGMFAFASEIKALRRLLGSAGDPDSQALGEFVTYGFTVGARTFYHDVHQLNPAHVMTLDVNAPNAALNVSRYWDVQFNPDYTLREADWLDRIDQAISESVRMRLMSDVPVGAFLSGGIDSSLVVAYMARHSPDRVRSFTIGFRESSHDESHYARAVADHLGVEHHAEYVEPDAVGVLEQLVQAYDEPYGDESAIPTYYLCQATRRHVTVALSGDGGDETFLGYRRYGLSQWMEACGTLMTPVGRAAVGSVAERLPISNRFRRLLQRQSLTGFDLYHHAMGYSPDMLALLHRDIRSELCASDENKMALDYRRCAARRRVERYGSVDLRNYLPDDILVKVDRASMHHSLEVRCPLLDHELIELAHQIPTRYKLRWGRGKLLLRTLLRRFLPVELIERPKMGFGVPLARWFRGELKPLLDDMLADRGSVVWQWLDHEVVASRFAAHQTERVNFQAALWRCLFLYCWTLQNRTHAEPAHCQRPLPQTT